MRTVREVSAGGVIYRWYEQRIEVALIHVRKRWGLPKGHVEEGERFEETAVREVREETGLLGKLDRKLGQISYSYRRRTANREPIRISKRVYFFLLQFLEGEVHGHDYEVDEARWVALDEALTKLSFATERKMLRKAKSLIAAEPSRAVNGGGQSGRQT